MNVTIFCQILIAVSTTLIAIAGVLAAYFYGYVPKINKQKLVRLQKELLDCYKNIQSLLEIEAEYMEEEGIGKQTTRRGKNLSSNIQPKKVQTRIEQLENELNH